MQCNKACPLYTRKRTCVYSMISTAVPSSDCGIVRPSAFAVLRLTISSYLVGERSWLRTQLRPRLDNSLHLFSNNVCRYLLYHQAVVVKFGGGCRGRSGDRRKASQLLPPGRSLATQPTIAPTGHKRRLLIERPQSS